MIRPQLSFDGDCGVCTRLAAWVAYTLPEWDVVPAADLGALRYDLGDTDRRWGAAAVNVTLGTIFPWLRPLLRMVEATPPLFAIERGAYAAFAARRATISRLIGAPRCGPFAPVTPDPCPSAVDTDHRDNSKTMAPTAPTNSSEG